MDNSKYNTLDFFSIKLIEENNRIFEFQNKFFKHFDKYHFSKINKLTQITDRFNFSKTNKLDSIEILNFYKKIELLDQTNKISKILSKSYLFNNMDHLLPKSIELSSYLNDFQKNNNSILEILNNKEFVEDFVNHNSQILDIDAIPQEMDINVFGDRINREIIAQQSNLETSPNIDPLKLSKDLLTVIFILFTFYINNLDSFSDIQEAIVFYINEIECKAVTISRVNLRIEPNFSSDAIMTIPKNSALKVYGETHNGWVKVKINMNGIDIDGYVSEAYIRRLH